MDVLISVSTTRKKIDEDDHYTSIVPELGLIYSILMKRRCKDHSRVQRFIAIALADKKVHQKVYDGLQRVGVTVSHCTTLKVQKQIAEQFQQELIDAVQSGRRFRIVGDNINFHVGVSHPRKGNAGHMEHWFGSAAIVQHCKFDYLPSLQPQRPVLQMPPQFFLPSKDDWAVIGKNDSVLIL